MEIALDNGLDDATKERLRAKYEQAADALREAAEFTARAAEYREAITAAPEQAAELRSELQALPKAGSAVEPAAPGDSEEMQREVDRQQSEPDTLKKQLAETTAETGSIEGRPVYFSSRMPEIERELTDIRRQLSSPELAPDVTSPGRVAERTLLRAQQSRLLSEQEMLKQEQPIRSCAGPGTRPCP